MMSSRSLPFFDYHFSANNKCGFLSLLSPGNLASPSVSEASTVPASDTEARQKALASYQASKATATPNEHGFNTPPGQVIRRLPTGKMVLGSPQQTEGSYTPTSPVATPAYEPAPVEPSGRPSASSSVKPVKKTVGKKKPHAKSKTTKSSKVSKGKGKKLTKTGKTKKGKLAGKKMKSKKNRKSKKNSKAATTGKVASAGPGGSMKRPPATPQASIMSAPAVAPAKAAGPPPAPMPATAAVAPPSVPATAAVAPSNMPAAPAVAPPAVQVKKEDQTRIGQDAAQSSRLDHDTRATLNRAGTTDMVDLATLQTMIQQGVQASLDTRSTTGSSNNQNSRKKPRDKERHNMKMRFYRSLESSLAA